MRKFILLFAVGFIGIHGFSQAIKADQVPQLIKDRVQLTFPQTMDIPVSWSKDKADFKASMIIMDAPASIIVDTLGKIKRIERLINNSYLPDKAKDYLKSLDPKYQVVSVLQITDEKEKVTYKTVARIKTDFTFDGKGNIEKK